MIEGGMSHPSSPDELHAFPRLRWALLFFLLWLICGVTPAILVYIGDNYFAIANSQLATVAGTIGDAFGLANSFFAGAALLFVIWSIRLQQQEIRFARDEWRQNTDSQKEQALTMKETAALAAINHIYSHYSGSYGDKDSTGVLSAVASGHRRWAIRESFSSIDHVFEPERALQVDREASQLAELLMVPKAEEKYMQEVATRTSSLLVDARAHESFRRALWPVYELLRSAPDQLCAGEGIPFDAFVFHAKEASSAWLSSRREASELAGEQADAADGASHRR
jgi:hypothetical protein